ncbi:hypothetical protein HanXRQr2_Chr12g0548331 [Helianthus annuus]|uniref:DUF4283 domain-containing protein n=1 Tax=Helianthus annuus TaxID=4232 RepID=A0A9K3MWQ1_HELAN|nr:hypothetical protein HanXRQr2_Chr12g0548331 [Helianthus annuus]KAJ0489906.1 hypothetical protein HanHA300_Chr12g0449291 [Helianthus annuus]KAJ0493935.1 hypothetical protein HanIR_Chr12g0591701 [Helianthus annuus]KAJ0675489.1 hypothetical protein HanLR1_Chr12g0451741 [Helianthus annuus]KAJ0678779.1 hypothetical protein HanOQP8_Chr12g0451751 [Helianthus annuus]
MGDCKLKANVVRFAVENSSSLEQQDNRTQFPGNAGSGFGKRNSNYMDFRSYYDVVGTSKGVGSIVKESEGSNVGEKRDLAKSIVMPDKTGAFKELFRISVVGRTVDLETLVDFDRLLWIAKIRFSRIQYLGGLTILVTFHDDVATNLFMDSKAIWGPWFTKLEVWSGQSLHFERVAWLKLSGIPLHLLDPDTLLLIGELYGKVLHVPKGPEEDQDLSMARVGVLAGEAYRIKEVVSLKWKDRSFRIWVEEELED